jgi:chemotaxis protein MotB
MDIPKGTSIIAKEFSPGKTEPTQMNTVNQFTTETTKPSLRVGNPTAPEVDTGELNDAQTQQLLEEKLQALILQTRADAEKLRELLKSDVEDGKIDIEANQRMITVRIREKGSFPSGSAELNTEFMPVMATLRDALRDIEGTISVEGHTDDIPISSARFESNWGLSASRALSVTHQLIKDNVLDSARFMLVGHADTQPFKPNDSWQNRAMNRRVEIIIRQGTDNASSATINELQKVDPSIMESLNLGGAG